MEILEGEGGFEIFGVSRRVFPLFYFKVMLLLASNCVENHSSRLYSKLYQDVCVAVDKL